MGTPAIGAKKNFNNERILTLHHHLLLPAEPLFESRPSLQLIMSLVTSQSIHFGAETSRPGGETDEQGMSTHFSIY